jgi:hypothetical protein
MKTCSHAKKKLNFFTNQKESLRNLPLYVWAEVWMKNAVLGRILNKNSKAHFTTLSLFNLLSHLFTLYTSTGRAAAAPPLPFCATAAAAAPPRRLPPAQPPNLPAGVR